MLALEEKRKRPQKTLTEAYTRAFLGLVTGILGWHRHYLNQPLVGMGMSGIFLGGLLGVVYTYVKNLSSLLNSLTVSLGNSSVPSPVTDLFGQTALLYPSFFLMGIGVCWWFIDLFRMPHLLRQCQK